MRCCRKIRGGKNADHRVCECALELFCVAAQRIPATIGNLKKLRLLDLEENKLEQLPAEIGFLRQLTKLVVQSNQLTSLPRAVGYVELRGAVGYVDVWCGGYVDLWCGGYVDLWCGGYVDVWCGGYVDVWCGGYVDVWCGGTLECVQTVAATCGPESKSRFFPWARVSDSPYSPRLCRTQVQDAPKLQP